MPATARRDFAVQVVQSLRDAGYEALWAGGCVRDILLGRTPEDYDVATNAVPDQVRQVFGRKRTYAVGESFGVIVVRGPQPHVHVEVATFRTEGPYLDGRRPEQVVFSTAREDAQRRDFTINGMFYDPLASRVLDYVGGEADLGRGMVRAIGEPHARMREDKLRMLRAVRFAAVLEFALDPVTAAAVRDMAADVTVVSVERIAQELRKMLVPRHRRRAAELLRDLGLLEQVLPELTAGFAARGETALRTLHLLEAPGFPLAAAALLHVVEPASPSGPDRAAAETVRAIGRRLRFSNEENDRAGRLIELRRTIRAWPTMSLAARKRSAAHPAFGELLAFARAESLALGEDVGPILACEEFLRAVAPEDRDPPPLLTGDDLVALGHRPGPQFKTWLDTVRDAQLDGTIASRDDAVALVARLRDGGA